MFEQRLSDKLKKIFDFDKVTFDQVSESQEEECLFIEVQSANTTIKDGLQVAKVIGKIRVFANTDKLPYGYFMKQISAASANDTRDLFFYDFEENHGKIGNVAERSLSFVYLFNSQYDPALGSITELNTTVEETT